MIWICKCNCGLWTMKACGDNCGDCGAEIRQMTLEELKMSET